MKNGQLIGYCELKSLFDFEAIEDPPEGGMAVRKNLPFYRKLGQHIRGASQQLDAGNPSHDKPDVLVFVTHTTEIERKDHRVRRAGDAQAPGPAPKRRWEPVFSDERGIPAGGRPRWQRREVSRCPASPSGRPYQTLLGDTEMAFFLSRSSTNSIQALLPTRSEQYAPAIAAKAFSTPRRSSTKPDNWFGTEVP
jgi:hypothetical protein